MSQEEHAAIEIHDRPCSIEVESNFKGEIAIRTKWYFEPTLESAWEAFQNLTKVRAALKVQYIGGTDKESEQALAFLREINTAAIQARGIPAVDETDYWSQLKESVERVKASKGNG